MLMLCGDAHTVTVCSLSEQEQLITTEELHLFCFVIKHLYSFLFFQSNAFLGVSVRRYKCNTDQVT